MKVVNSQFIHEDFIQSTTFIVDLVHDSNAGMHRNANLDVFWEAFFSLKTKSGLI